MAAEVNILQQACVFLGASIVAVPLAKRLGLGSVLGYLLAGVLIGPFALALVGNHVEELMHFSEFGVVMMLFLVGLELRPSELWKMRLPIIGLGGGQVALCSILIALLVLMFSANWKEALVVGMVLSLSSTAIVLQILSEKKLLKTQAGEASFSILLFQDIAVIPMLTVIPLLASQEFIQSDDAHGLSAGMQALAVLALVAGMIIVGKQCIRPIFRMIATTQMRELFTAMALFIVISIAMLMEMIGLSAALGTFIAGVVLAESEYRHELEAELEPFKGLLLGLFFITVGASINFELLISEFFSIAFITLALIIIKIVVIYCLGKIFRLNNNESLLMAFALAQGGEFAFVLFSYAKQAHAVSTEFSDLLIVSVALSMALTPLLFIVFEKIIQPKLLQPSSDDAPVYDVMDAQNSHVILVGYGRFGQIIGRLLLSNNFHVTFLEQDPSQVEMVRRFGNKVFYGDASRYDLLQSAGAKDAQLIILANDNHEKTLEIFNTIKKHFPQPKVFARARGRQEAQELLEVGVDFVIRETYGSALDMAEKALSALGVPAYQAHRASKIFRHYDEKALHDLIGVWKKDEQQYILRAKQNSEQLEKAIQSDLANKDVVENHAWEDSARE